MHISNKNLALKFICSQGFAEYIIDRVIHNKHIHTLLKCAYVDTSNACQPIKDHVSIYSKEITSFFNDKFNKNMASNSAEKRLTPAPRAE